MGLTISWNLSVNFYANPLASPCDAIWSSSPSTLRHRYEIVPRTEKMSACQTLKARNLLGMFLLVCVTVVREPHAQAGSHTTLFSLSLPLLFCRSLPPPQLAWSSTLHLIFSPSSSLVHTHIHVSTHAQWHTPCLFLRWSRLSGCYTGALMYYHISGGPCPLDKRLFNTI